MCDPITALTVGSAVVGAGGQMKEANANARASKYNAQVAEMNAGLAEQQAKDAIYRGQLEEQNQRRATAGLIGQQRAAMAANGVDVSYGSPLDMIVDSAKLGELDAMMIRQNSRREADDIRQEAANNRGQASLLRSQAKTQKAGGKIGALGTLLGSGANAWSGYQTRSAAQYGG